MLSSHLSTHVAYPAIARVAAAILPYAAPDEGLVTPLEALQRITQSQLAVIAGTAKEVAGRAVAELEAAGALERTQGPYRASTAPSYKHSYRSNNQSRRLQRIRSMR